MIRPPITLLRFSAVALAATVSAATPPKDRLDRIVAHVAESRDTEALAETDALLKDYPDDPGLKSIREQLLAAKPAPGPAKPALTGRDRLAIGTTVQGVRRAVAERDGPERVAAFRKVLALPVPANAESGDDWLPYWQARAFAALTLDDLEAGRTAVLALKKLDALEKADESLGAVLGDLNLRGWWEMDRAAFDRELASRRVAAKRKADWAAEWQRVAGAGKIRVVKELIVENPAAPKFVECRSGPGVVPGKDSGKDYAAINELRSAEFSRDYRTLTVRYTRSVSTVQGNVAGGTTSRQHTRVYTMGAMDGRTVLQDDAGNLYTNPVVENRIARERAEIRRRQEKEVAMREQAITRLNDLIDARFRDHIAAKAVRSIADLKLELIPLVVARPPMRDITPAKADTFDYEKDFRERVVLLGKTEITQAQYAAVMGENPSDPKADDLPVNGVTWRRALDYCDRLTEREHKAGRLEAGWRFTLPTEAQWNRAAAGLDMSRYGEHAWLAGMPRYEKSFWGGFYFDGYVGNSRLMLQPVAGLAASPLGFHDLVGNVQEWMLDVPDGDWRLVKGGCYMSAWKPLEPLSAMKAESVPAGETRIGYRVGEDDYEPRRTIGFRIALVHESNPETAAVAKKISR